LLVVEVLKDAKAQKLNGVAVITSDGSFMSKKELFLKNGFELIEEKDEMQLLVKNFGKGNTLPHLNYDENALAKYQGWHIIYSRQCPWVARFIEEVKPIIEKEGLKVNFEEITTATQAQKAPSIYATFNLIKDGKLLSDRYISTTRFKNILKQNK